MKRSLRRLVMILAAAMVLTAAATVAVSACTTIYVGADRNKEGTPFVCRTEDYGSDMNKMWFISEDGAFKEGSTYKGCPAYGGFEWTWTHDTYRFTYFTNDVLYDGTCPECGEGTKEEPVTHYSYTEFGTNDKGVSVSATETIYGNSKVKAVDPMHDSRWMAANPDKGSGIEETDIPTVILGEAASAREGIELLMDIYDTRGAFYASGLFIADQNETWYIENCSGTQYVALKLPQDLVFIEPNMAVIGRVDLDDTENVIASKDLIKVAQDAESFVGDAEANVIDFRASYADRLNRMDNRMVQGLNYLNKDYNYDGNALIADNTRFTISNVAEGGAIAPIYTNIQEDRELTTEDILGFYHLSTVGKSSNQEIEIFQLFKDRPLEYGTVGWVGVGDMSYGLFVPCYPMLLDSMYEGYQVPTAKVTRMNTIPENGFFTSRSNRYYQYPENWKDSYYFSFEGLGNLMAATSQVTGGTLDESYVKDLQERRDQKQAELISDFISYDALAASDDPRAAATANMKAMSAKAHEFALNAIERVQLEAFSMGASTQSTNDTVDVKAVDLLKATYNQFTDEQKAMVNGLNMLAFNSAVQRAQIVDLEAKAEELATAAAEANAKAEAAQAALDAAQEASAAEIAALKEEAAAAQTAADAAQATADEAKAELAATKAKEELLEAQLAEAKAAQDASAAEIAALKEAVEKAQAAADAANAELAAQKAAAEAAKAAAAEKAAKVAAAKKLTVKGLAVKAKAQKAVVTFKKTKGASAYQVQYKLAGKKWGNLAKSTTKAKVTSKKLKKGKKYSFRVRTISKVDGKAVYGKWTKAKTVKIK